ncbi:hypothetical protein ACLD9I_004716 [Pseudomonas aeruginosa]
MLAEHRPALDDGIGADSDRSKQEQQLKAFQVGEQDMVAHYTPEQAHAFLCDFAAYAADDIGLDQVTLVPDALLDAPMRDEDGKACPPLRLYLDAATEPTYLHGWE